MESTEMQVSSPEVADIVYRMKKILLESDVGLDK